MAKALAKYQPEELTEQARLAAYLDSQGLDREEIAEKLNVHHDTVARWRGTAAYKAEVDRCTSESRALLEPLLLKERAGALKSKEKARAGLEEAMAAVDTDGRPIWSVRLAAYKIVYGDPFLTGMVDPQAAQVDVNVSAPTILQVFFREDGTVEDQPTDADFEEVNDDEPGTAPGEGDDPPGGGGGG